MDLKAQITNISRNYLTKSYNISLITEQEPTGIEDLMNKDLSVRLSECRKGRSLNANAYFYTLVNKIAQKENISDIEVHDKLLSENLCYFYENGAIDWVIQDWKPNNYRLVRRGEDYYYDSLQVVRLTKDDGTPFKANGKDKVSKIFWHVKGSHQMDTKEMAKLIDATVEEAKGLGIETMLPEEIERLKALWK